MELCWTDEFRLVDNLKKNYDLKLTFEESQGEEVPEDDYIDSELLFDSEKVNEMTYTADEAKILKAIAKRIVEWKACSKKFNRYDYFVLGGMNFKRAASIICSMRRNGEFTKGEYSNIMIFVNVQMRTPIYRSRSVILNTYFQFGDYVVSMEEKEQIWNNLLANGMALENIDDVVFSGAVREYAIEHELIANVKAKKKKRVKRK